MARVFISHAAADTSIAEAVRDWLRSQGHQVFLDRDIDEGLRVGQKWKDRLFAELRAADAVICLISRAFLRSAWCAAEIGFAEAVGARLLPLLVKPGLSAPLLADRQYVQYGPDRPWREEIVATLRDIDAAGGLGWADNRSPFPGLDPFDLTMARAFYGRHDEVRELAGRLRSPGTRTGGGLLVVVGPSGCGKSSLIRAGLAARMAADPEWEVAYPMLPGSDPVRELAKALTATANQHGLDWTVADTHAALAEDGGLAPLADELLCAGPGAPRERLLLLVDQGEELLTRVAPDDAVWFLDLLREATAGPVRVVLTLRSELMDDLLALADLEVDTFPLRPLTRDELRLVIEEPARLAGLSMDHELVERLVADTGGGEALPLLAFTLNRLTVGLVRGDTVSAERYEEFGGVRGALTRHADAALAAAREATGRTKAEVLATLVRLATLDAAGQPTRRRVDRAEVGADDQAVFDAFVDRRLLTTAGDEDGVWIGVAHEALLTWWGPLAEAITAQAAALRASGSVERDAAEWERAGRSNDYLWERGRISEARRLLGGTGLSPTATAFLRAGRRHGERVRIRAIALLSIALLLVSAGGIAALAQRQEAREQRQDAREQRRGAVGRQLVQQAQLLVDSQPRIALALSIEAYRIAPELPEVTDNLLSLQARYYAGLLQPRIGAVHEVALTADGTQLAAAGHDGAVSLWRLPNPTPRRLAAVSPVYAVAFSPDGRYLAAGGEAGRDGSVVQVWDSQTGRLVVTLPAAQGAVNGVAFSPDGRWLAAGGTDDEVLLWRRVAGWPRAPWPHPPEIEAPVNALAFSPDSRTLVGGVAHGLGFWQVPSAPATGLPGTVSTSPSIRAVAVSKDFIVAGGNDGSVRLWDARTRTPVVTTIEHTGAVQAVAVSPDGELVASAGDDGAVRLWTAGAPLGRLSSLLGPTGRVLGLAFGGADGRTLAGGGTDTAVGLWNVAGAPDERLPTVTGAAAFGPDGQLATAGQDHVIRRWQQGPAGPQRVGKPLKAGRPAREVRHRPFGMAFGPDGTVLATPVDLHSAALWNLRGDAMTQVDGIGKTLAVHAVALSPDGTRLAAGSDKDDSDVALWSTSSAESVDHLDVIHTQPINGIAVGPAPREWARGLVLATASEDGYLAVSVVDEDPRRGGRGGARRVLPEYNLWPVNAVALSRDGHLLASGSEDGQLRLWQAAQTLNQWTDLRPEAPVTPARSVVSVAFRADGRMLAAASLDGTVRIWTLQPSNGALAARLTATLAAPPGTTAVAFPPGGDDRLLLTSDQAGTPTLWSTDPGAIRQSLCAGGPRPMLSAAEWETYVRGEPYREVCR